MDFRAWRIAQVLAVLQLLTVIALHGVYTSQWGRLTADQVMPLVDRAVLVAALLFILLPIAAVIGLFRYRRWGFYPLILFPLVAIVFGTIPIPFASMFFSSDVQFTSKVIVVVNSIFVIVGVALLRYSRPIIDAAQ